MFRALAQLDSDFTRHIEGHALRLHWDENSLFRLVTRRLRVALDLQEVENDVKVWNRFAQRELKDKDGFEHCLRHTLYRPRDILVLLNEAYMSVLRDKREEIVGSDVEGTAKQISQNRLEDLMKEYERVLPGLKLFVSLFEGGRAQESVGAVADRLDEVVF